MRYLVVPFAALIALMIARMLSPQPPANSADVKYFWLAVYTYELPKGLQTEGEHTYQFNFSYTAPKPGSLIGQPHHVKVSAQAPLFQKSVLLRPGGQQALSQTNSCAVIKQVNPNQPVKFMVAWVPDIQYTKADFTQQIQSMKATVSWDNQPPVNLVFQQASISWSALYECQPWVDPTGNGQQLGLLLP